MASPNWQLLMAFSCWNRVVCGVVCESHRSPAVWPSLWVFLQCLKKAWILLCLWVFSSPEEQTKNLLSIAITHKSCKEYIFSQRLWDALLLFIMALWPIWCRCKHLPLPCVVDTSVVPHPCQFSASPAQLPTRSPQLFRPLLVKGSPLFSLWCS